MTDNVINLNEQSSELKKSEQSIVEMYFSSNVINNDDWKKLIESKQFMLDTFQSVPMYRSLPIKLFGVLNDSSFPTPESKYYQCKAEAEVHSNELIKDLHDLELMKIDIEQAEYLLAVVMKNKFDKSNDEIEKQEITFDMRKQNIIISNKKFDYAILQKKIKYRIMEISEWKTISDKIASNKDFNNVSYNDVLLHNFALSFEQKINNPNTPDNEKEFYKNQLLQITNIKK